MLAVLHHKKCQGGCKVTIGPEDVSERDWKRICNMMGIRDSNACYGITVRIPNPHKNIEVLYNPRGFEEHPECEPNYERYWVLGD